MFDNDIRLILANYSSDGTNATIPLATLPKVTAGEAHTSTGDSRKFLYALIDAIAVAIAATDTDDKSNRMTVVKNTPVSISDGIVRQSYNFDFDLALGDADVAAEA